MNFPRARNGRKVRVRGPRMEIRENGTVVSRRTLYVNAPNKALQALTALALAGDGAYTVPREKGQDAE